MDSELLADIAEIIYADLSEQKLYPRLFQVVRRVIPFHAATLFTRPDGAREFQVTYKEGPFVVNLADEVDFTGNDGIVSWAAARKKPLIVESLRKARPGRAGLFLSFLSIPLWSRKNLLGVINFAQREENVYRQDQKDTYAEIGLYISLILDRAQTNRRVRDQHRQLQKVLQKLKATQDELVKKEKLAAIGQIVARVNHEINNPLTAIIGLVELLELSWPSLTEAKIKQSLTTIRQQAHKIEKLTARLRAIDNPDSEPYVGQTRMTSLPPAEQDQSSPGK